MLVRWASNAPNLKTTSVSETLEVPKAHRLAEKFKEPLALPSFDRGHGSPAVPVAFSGSFGAKAFLDP